MRYVALSRRVAMLVGGGAIAVGLMSLSAPALAASGKLEYHGYFRSQFGVNNKGGNQVCFQNPGAPAKLRLGNQCSNYGELILQYDMFQTPQKKDGLWFKTVADLAWSVPGDSNYEQYAPAWRQSYIQVYNLFPDGPLAGASVWVGKRYYRWNEIYSNDFYFQTNTGGAGVGISNIDLGLGKFSYALIRSTNNLANLSYDVTNGSGKTLYYVPSNNSYKFYKTGTAPKDAQVQKTTIFGQPYLEARAIVLNNVFSLDEVKGLGGIWRFVLSVRSLSGQDAKNYKGKTGLMGTVGYTHKMFGGFNQAVLQWGNGLASSLGATSDYNATTSIKTYRILDHMVYQPNERYSGEFWALYQHSTGPLATGATESWTQIGAMPVYNFTRHLNVALGLSTGRVKPKNDNVRNLTVVSLIPQIAAGPKFFARPVLRLYATYAKWNDAARDAGVVVSGPASTQNPFVGDTSGWSYGAQAEVWW